jgi:hypothetical protein
MAAGQTALICMCTCSDPRKNCEPRHTWVKRNSSGNGWQLLMHNLSEVVTCKD